MKWLDDIRIGSKPLPSDSAAFAGQIDVLKNADSGVGSINTAIKDLPYTQVGDEVHVNDVARWRDMEVEFRKGNVNKAFSDANVSSSVSAADEALLKKTLKQEAPDIDIAELETKMTEAKKYHDDLDVKATNGAELESKLDSRSKEKAKSMYGTILNVVKVGSVAAGVFAAVLLTGKVYDDLADAANSMDGCFIAYKASDTVACKIVSRSCGFSDKGSAACDTAIMDKTIFNINLMVRDIINSAATADVDALKALGCEWADGDTADIILSKSNNIPILTEYYPTKYNSGSVPAFDPCVLGEISSGCVACNSSLQTNDIQYCTSDTLESSMVYKCKTDTTVIEALTDIATSLGISIFTASGDSISGSFQGNFFLAVIIILVIIAAIAFAVKLIPRKEKKDPTVSVLDTQQQQPPMQQQQQTQLPQNQANDIRIR
ncbi:PIF-5 [Carcinus maenas nudivirus]|uniref:PIF-5 n=1 Tax=Carcinus maenas nudivirus TaxID=2880837 RepID=A0AAE8Y036_9VIRU|nr:PIF-5 [Carcinus maenas nudivirus]UBZ25596.1 PIF-5 [Carcinus maenas nudivirus]